jgi:sugar (pentulose or hexulose) kinase
MIDDKNEILASGGYTWNNKLIDGYYSYSLDEVWQGIRESYRILKEEVKDEYGITLKNLKAIGISAMMHGYLSFDKDDKLLTPFRTWRNTTTEVDSNKLSKLFNFSIPQRWSISHLYQAILDSEEHIENIDKLHTLASYIHYKLTEEYVIGIGDASGMVPIDSNLMC